MTDIKSLDDAVAYLRKRMNDAKQNDTFAVSTEGSFYNQGQYDAFGEAIEAITGKTAAGD